MMTNFMCLTFHIPIFYCAEKEKSNSISLICKDGGLVGFEYENCAGFEYLTKLYKKTKSNKATVKRFPSKTIKYFRDIISNATDLKIEGKDFFEIFEIIKFFKPRDFFKERIYGKFANIGVYNISQILEYYDKSTNRKKIKDIDMLFWVIFLKKLAEKEKIGLTIDNGEIIIHFNDFNYQFIGTDKYYTKISKLVLNFYPTVDNSRFIGRYRAFAFVISHLLGSADKENFIGDLTIDYKRNYKGLIMFLSYFRGKYPRVVNLSILCEVPVEETEQTHEMNLLCRYLIENTDISPCEKIEMNNTISLFLSRFYKLKTLNMEINVIAPTILQIECLKNISVGKRLTHITFGSGGHYNGDAIDLKALSGFKKLKRVDIKIQSSEIASDILKNINSKNKIAQIVFENGYNFPKESILEINKFKKIRRLEIRNPVWAACVNFNFLESATIQNKLRELYLTNITNFSEEQGRIVGKLMNLEVLEFKGCSFDYNGLSALLNSINLHNSIKKLSFSMSRGFFENHLEFILLFERLEMFNLHQSGIKKLSCKKILEDIKLRHKNKKLVIRDFN